MAATKEGPHDILRQITPGAARWIAHTLLLFICLAAPPTHADALYGTMSETSTYVQVYGSFDQQIENIDCLHANADGTPACGDGARSATSTIFPNVASASASAVPLLGHLSGAVSVFRSPVSPAGYDTRGSAIASLQSFWYDTFTVTSTTLDLGTAVTLDLTVDLVASLLAPEDLGICSTSSGGAGGCASAQAIIHEGGPDGGWLASASMRTPTTLDGGGTGIISTPNPGTGIIDTFVGDTFQLWGELDLSATVGTGSTDPHSYSASAEAMNSAHFFITSMTAGADLVTASGMSYSPTTSSVPEPSSLSLMLGTLVLLFMFRRAPRVMHRRA